MVLSILIACAGPKETDDCPRSLDVMIRCSGDCVGTGYYRESRVTMNDVLVSSRAYRLRVDDSGSPIVQYHACFSDVLEGDEEGWVIDFWIDRDGDDWESCDIFSENSIDDTYCMPDEGEIQIKHQYTMKASGNTLVNIQLHP